MVTMVCKSPNFKQQVNPPAAAGGLLQFGLPKLRGRRQQLIGKVAPYGGADLRHIRRRRTEPV
jgi:hypothetical protein